MIFSGKSCATAVLLICIAFAHALRGQDERIYFRHFELGENSDRYLSGRILEKAKYLAEICLPGPPGSEKAGSVVFEMDRTGKQKRLEARHGKRKNEVRIRFPGRAALWEGDIEQMSDLAAWCLLAKMGRGPENALGIRTHWIVRALARHLVTDEAAAAAGLPFTRSYPMAYALASHGIFASFDSILISAPAGTPPGLRDLSDEYASLLFDICRQTGLLKGGLVEKLLSAELDGTGDESMSFFAAAAEVSFPERARNALPSGIGEGRNLFPSWFERYAEHLLLSFFTPVSAAQFETLYRENARIRIVDPNTFEVSWIPIASLTEQQTAPENAELTETSRRLSILAGITPPGLQEPLTGVRQALNRVRTGGMIHAQEVREAESALIRETGRLCGIERYLAKVQAKQIGPGVRLDASLRSLRTLRMRTKPETGIERLLDQWDEYR